MTTGKAAGFHGGSDPRIDRAFAQSEWPAKDTTGIARAAITP